ncbi:hypothetical protein ACFQS6_00270 [Xanthomonas populi]
MSFVEACVRMALWMSCCVQCAAIASFEFLERLVAVVSIKMNLISPGLQPAVAGSARRFVQARLADEAQDHAGHG